MRGATVSYPMHMDCHVFMHGRLCLLYRRPVTGRPVGGTLTPIGIHRRGGLRPFWYGSPTLCTTQRSGAARARLPTECRQEREHPSRVAPGEMPVESATRVRYWERSPNYRPLRAQLEPSPITTYFMSRYLYAWGIEDCFYRSSRKYSGDRLEAGRRYHPPQTAYTPMTGDMHTIANTSAHVVASWVDPPQTIAKHRYS